MKKVISLLCVLVASLASNAQKIHFTDTTNVWEQYINEYNDGHGLISYHTYGFQGDTVVAGIDYRKFNFGIFTGNPTLVREDTVLGRVYVRDVVADSDVLLMDYNLTVGDTLITSYESFTHQYYKFVVQSIDSVMINSVWHRVWHFPHSVLIDVGYWDAFDIIEGIGCIQHPVFSFSPAGIEPPTLRVYCFSNSGVTSPVVPAVKHFNNTTSCTYFPTLNASEATAAAWLSLFPNPANGQLKIVSQSPILDVSVSNTMGQVVYRRSSDARQLEIDVSALAPGLYFVRVNNAEVRNFFKQ